MVALRRIGRDEGKRIDPPAQRVPEGRGARVTHGRTRRDGPERGAVLRGVLTEGRLSHAVGQQRRQIDVGDRRRARERESLGLRQQLAAVRHQPVAVPCQVGRRFAEARRAVQLRRQVLRRRHADEVATVLPLADRDVRRREIREHGGAGERRERARRDGRPEVLADLRVQREPVHVRERHEDVGAERDVVTEELDRVAARRRRRLEPARLVELAIAGRVGLRCHGDGPAAVERHGAVEEAAVDRERRADRDQQIPRRGLACQTRERGEDAAQQRLLEEQVAARVRGQPELGADGVLHTGGVYTTQRGQVGVDVERGIRDPDLGNAHGHAREAVSPDVEKGGRHVARMIPRVLRLPNPAATGAHPAPGGGRDA